MPSSRFWCKSIRVPGLRFKGFVLRGVRRLEFKVSGLGRA